MHRNRYGLWQRCPKPASGFSRGQELVARRTGRVEDRIGVILAVAQQVAATVQFWNHLFTNFIFTGVHGIHAVRLGHRPAAPNRVQFVAFGPHPGPAAAVGIGGLAGPADREWLGIDHSDELRVSFLAHPLHQGPHQHRGVHSAEPPTEGRRVGQRRGSQSGRGPVPTRRRPSSPAGRAEPPRGTPRR